MHDLQYACFSYVIKSSKFKSILSFHLFDVTGGGNFPVGNRPRIVYKNYLPTEEILGENSSQSVYPYQFTKENPPEGHQLVPLPDNRKKDCKYCRRHFIKTKRGYSVQTQYKCSVCDVALCSGVYKNRNCFIDFHNEVNQIRQNQAQ